MWLPIVFVLAAIALVLLRFLPATERESDRILDELTSHVIRDTYEAEMAASVKAETLVAGPVGRARMKRMHPADGVYPRRAVNHAATFVLWIYLSPFPSDLQPTARQAEQARWN